MGSENKIGISATKVIIISAIVSALVTCLMLFIYHRQFNMVITPNAAAPGIDIRDLAKQNEEISGEALGKIVDLQKRVDVLEAK